MKINKQLTICMIVASCLSIASISSETQFLQPANEFQIPLNGISDLIISYDEEKIVFFESKTNDLVIKEYMTKNKSSYYAKTEQYGNSIKICEGGKPFLKGAFSRFVEVYIPIMYHKNLTVTTTNGDIDFSKTAVFMDTLRLDSTKGIIRLYKTTARNVYISSTSGLLDLGDLEAQNIRIETTRGNTLCNKLKGDVIYASTSGSATIETAVGSGSYKMNNSGILNVSYTLVINDLSFYNKNGTINVAIPANLEFNFRASTKNGLISTNFQDDITFSKKNATGIIGNRPVITITAETNNGNIYFIR